MVSGPVFELDPGHSSICRVTDRSTTSACCQHNQSTQVDFISSDCRCGGCSTICQDKSRTVRARIHGSQACAEVHGPPSVDAVRRLAQGLRAAPLGALEWSLHGGDACISISPSRRHRAAAGAGSWAPLLLQQSDDSAAMPADAPAAEADGEDDLSSSNNDRPGDKLDFSVTYALSGADPEASGICPTITMGNVYAMAREGCVHSRKCRCTCHPHPAYFTSTHMHACMYPPSVPTPGILHAALERFLSLSYRSSMNWKVAQLHAGPLRPTSTGPR